ncbi:hypothetical protein TMatcc_009261 [Talaromyces marneffei ATCC 18224]|uniref:Cell cycle inhibitor Nif1, putative n=2 Tax=Talaromyces marneffei TaxID=37727 RepID=B6QMZ8_TALMQ|nr:cell cycle inhibitor Nif1, putative [Talaromyces marneffei ATCC 18224]KAE8551158.1 hypothetical protein EYB25_007392 [Talaromyces marneffei]
MSSRLDLLDVYPGADSAGGNPTPHMPSPRVEHFDGEVPPNLSPLDAFAMQSRALARQLDESMRRDRRMSRLPPQSVARSLSQPRPGYFRSGPDQASRRAARSPDPNAHHAFAEEPKFRPQSQHPRISGLSILHSEEDDSDLAPIPDADPNKGLAGEYFHSLRAESPEEDPSLQNSSTSTLSTNTMPHIRTPSTSRESSYDSIPPPSAASATLAPASPIPPSLYYNNGQVESSDDDYTSSNGGSTWSKSRKLSTGSGISMPHSPMSPFVRSHPRSPSVSSEASNYLPRPSFNFSRPLSRSSTSMSLPAPSPVISSETPSQSNSNASTPAIDQRPTNGIRRENKPAPIVLGAGPMSVVGEEPPSSAVSSYVYAKYSLPRGRMVSRNSLVFAGLQTPHFEWKEPLFQSSPTSEYPPSPEARSKEPPVNIASDAPTPKPGAEAALDVATRVDPLDTVPAATVRQSHEIVRETGERPVLQRSYSERLDDTMSVSTESNSTIRPLTAKTTATTSPVMEQTAEEHVEKGIECHEKGALQESTYHLRIAAKQNHPTGMLLYALACRHGWGMRANQKEGVQWLRKAVDSAGLEIGEDDEAPTGGKDPAARKARRAQFALGIYELGVSHLNGWGIEQDKVLALRCFEIASQWGDADALAEAGFCYAEGIGCKKNLKKAAHYYRLAEAKGISMVGNSWIYKDKYMSDEDDSKRSRQSRERDTGASEKKPRSKSRTRSIFARKRPTA